MDDITTQTARPKRATSLPPRWIIRGFWVGHRALLRATGDRVGLAAPAPGGRFGMLRLRTLGRRSGQEREAVIGYAEDGANIVTLAMNGWGAAEPAWLLNLRAHPEAHVDLVGGETRRVRAREATGDERDRLWALIDGYEGYGDLEAMPALRGTPTAVVVLEPAD
ncbi:nitroreductase family deazaflavin-dependent oxidoreductase [Microbacterium thalassium]|uniref:Deazaflavin-dependent oxidoreductase (Nitroreductase family) n=1 Tax=Microbacterium thalassium TaxID=362649 RepID=A0A7X0FN21_9MICO|nr:nitroreductase family deazaflavin-dependent oxidoreductase [Microbacterium thalassium]MBB6390471.1 deazaflavin-dependent oxidoreductase (nitroreductase family) [Microbacterium thalassium]GLK25581.1 hypothetical protein GCM10017607_29000 [Microbacterium thalassium]